MNSQRRLWPGTRILFSSMILAAVAGIAAAAEITVGAAGCDVTRLQEAVRLAEPGRNVIVLMDPVHTEAGIVVDRDVSIRGFGAGKTVLQAAAGPQEAEDRVLVIQEGVRATVSSLTIRHGNPREPLRCGGGVQNFGDLVLEDCVVCDNAAVYGVGIWNRGRLLMRRCTVSGNQGLRRTTAEVKSAEGCTGSGAGIKNEPHAELSCEDCTIWGNSAQRRGGGLFVSCESTARLVNCTVSGNRSVYEGGGIHVRGDAELVHCTIAFNQSSRQGGGIFNIGRLDLVCCLVAGNRVGDFVSGVGAGIYGEGRLERNEHNLVADGSLEGCLAGDALLEPLAANGGTTATHALQSGSPAVDAVPLGLLIVRLDQRGLPRAAGSGSGGQGGDIGAFERQ